MIEKDKMRFGLKVKILSDNNLGEIGYVEHPESNDTYYVVIPGIERYFIYKLEELELA
jgi:hypothetical protein